MPSTPNPGIQTRHTLQQQGKQTPSRRRYYPDPVQRVGQSALSARATTSRCGPAQSTPWRFCSSASTDKGAVCWGIKSTAHFPLKLATPGLCSMQILSYADVSLCRTCPQRKRRLPGSQQTSEVLLPPPHYAIALAAPCCLEWATASQTRKRKHRLYDA